MIAATLTLIPSGGEFGCRIVSAGERLARGDEVRSWYPGFPGSPFQSSAHGAARHRIRLQQLFEHGRFVAHEWRCNACGGA